ncbi:MAG: ChrR family anti-sigma-E factor [Granulosicoccus sp.]|nr:ChrR family anti-sigma-E factor [Granulosicoccus sp.]
MTIDHHLTDETLQDYAAGALDHSLEVVIACHLTLCSECRRKSGMIDTVGGLVLQDSEASTTKASAADIFNLDARRSEYRGEHNHTDDSTNDPAQLTPPLTPTVPGVPRPLGRLLPATLEDLHWKTIAPGIKQHNLSSKHRKHGAFKLLHLSPGVVLSQHSHQDRELSLVLRGSYHDEIGRFKAGDIADLGDDVLHQPVVDTDEPCIALIATQSPVRYTGVVGRLLQPFIGI